MKPGQLILIFSLFVFFLTNEVHAQIERDSIKYKIETMDGNEFIGTIKEETGEHIVLQTDNLGEITVKIKDIKRRTTLETALKVGNEYWLDNPQSTRYFFQPNGYGLKAGEGYYQNVWVLFNSFAVGVTDHFSLGGGLVPLFLFGGTSSPAWLTPKLSIPVSKDKVNLGLGVFAATVIGEEDANFGILYGIGTFGTKDKNVSFGVGYGYAAGELTRRPAITLSAMIRLGPRSYFLSENYFISVEDNENVYIISFGGRHIIKKVGIDYGLFIPGISDKFVAIPWLGLTIPFGR